MTPEHGKKEAPIMFTLRRWCLGESNKVCMAFNLPPHRQDRLLINQ